MKINWLENPLKLTISANLFSLMGAIYFLLFWLLFWYCSDTDGALFAFVIIMVTITNAYLVLSAIVVLAILGELLFKHRMENKFVRENKIYNALFYLGFVFNTIAILLIAYLYKIPIQEYFSLLF